MIGTIKLDKIIEGSRTRKAYTNIDELAESILLNGLITPIAVCPQKSGDFFLLAGGRRFKALQRAKELADAGRESNKIDFENIPARFYSEPITTTEMKRIELHENIDREDLTFAEEANLIEELHLLEQKIKGIKGSGHNDPGHSIRDTAKILDKSPTHVLRKLELAEGLRQFPELADCKNENEAVKMLSMIEEKFVLAELSKRAKVSVPKTDEDEIKKQLIEAFVVGNFFNRVKTIPDGTIDLIELDPDYGFGIKNAKKLLNNKTSNKDYHELSTKDFLNKEMKPVLTECYRVMKKNSWLVLWFAQSHYYDSIFALAEKIGFIGNKLPGIWTKNVGQTKQPSFNLGNSAEFFFYLRKGSPSIIKQGRLNTFNYDVVPAARKRHPTERPIGLIKDILSTFAMPGAHIFVPFLGSGNTILAANDEFLNMKAFGFDLSESYKDKYIEFVMNGKVGNYNSTGQEFK